jgi:hypothetical protein
MKTRLEELAIAFREHEVTNENQIGDLTNQLDQVFTEEKGKLQIEKSQNAKGQSKMLNQLRDDTARYKSEAELSKQTTSSKQQQATTLAAMTLSEQSVWTLPQLQVLHLWKVGKLVWPLW